MKELVAKVNEQNTRLEATMKEIGQRQNAAAMRAEKDRQEADRLRGSEGGSGQ